MPIIEMTAITVQRGPRTILADVTWRVEAGEQWIVMGSNGSGKTTLLTLLTGYEWPTSGHVSVLGHPFGSIDLRDLRKRIGWVSHPLLEWMTRNHGHETVMELVDSGRLAMVGRGPASENPEPVREAMDRFGVGRLAQARFAGLSQGEKTRVALARAWMADIAVFILDEPCAGLDIKGREDLLQMVGQYLGRREKPVQLIYVTHHPEEILPGFTHILILKDGRVFAQGPRNDVLTDRLISTAFDAPLRIHNRANRPWIEVLSTS